MSKPIIKRAHIAKLYKVSRPTAGAWIEKHQKYNIQCVIQNGKFEALDIPSNHTIFDLLIQNHAKYTNKVKSMRPKFKPGQIVVTDDVIFPAVMTIYAIQYNIADQKWIYNRKYYESQLEIFNGNITWSRITEKRHDSN